jgi:hypothetical protein
MKCRLFESRKGGACHSRKVWAFASFALVIVFVHTPTILFIETLTSMKLAKNGQQHEGK